jgi:hypothetical protein
MLGMSVITRASTTANNMAMLTCLFMAIELCNHWTMDCLRAQGQGVAGVRGEDAVHQRLALELAKQICQAGPFIVQQFCCRCGL